MTRSVRFAAVVSVLLVGLQASTFVTGSLAWPFYGYSMYSTAITMREPRGLTRKVFATLDDGSKVRLGHDDVGIGRNVWRRQYTRNIESPEVIERLRRAVRWNTGREMTGLEVHVVSKRVTDGAVTTVVRVRQIHVSAEGGDGA